MKKLFFYVAFSALLLFASCCNNTVTTTLPVQLIFDTDMGPDYDDVGALTLLHALADSGEVNILATVSSNINELVVPCIDVINHYYGRPDIPIGAPRTGVDLGAWHKDKWTEALPEKFPHNYKSTSDAPDAVQVYRRILAEAEDSSVVIVTVGFLTNLANLLQSPADEFSELNGKQLVTKKVNHLVAMAGGFPQGREFNVFCDSESSGIVFELWPTPIILSGFEIGSQIFTGKELVASNIQNTPAKETYTMCLRQDNPEGRESWDQTAVLVAVRGAGKYFNTVKGRIVVESDGSNTWQDNPNGQHEYLTWKMPIPELTKVIEELMSIEN